MPIASHVLGIDGGTEGLRCGVFRCSDGAEVAYASSPYPTTFPHPGQAEQQPADWWAALVAAVRAALAKAESDHGVTAADVGALCVDTTCCSVVALSADGTRAGVTPLRPCLLWMDMRSAQQAARIAATGDPALCVNGAGTSPVSAEWFLCKALWLKEHEPATWAAATHVCEYQDYINLRLTGRYVGSTNNAAIRWHFQGGTAPPVSLLAALDLTDLLGKWPSVMVAPGSPIGAGLTPDAASALGLPPGLLVAQGGADAFIGMLGLGGALPIAPPGMSVAAH
jgi:ribulose kinase